MERKEPMNHRSDVSRAAYETGTVPIGLSSWLPPTALAPHGRLTRDTETDVVVVVGAGLAGAGVELGLAERKVDVVVLEAQ